MLDFTSALYLGPQHSMGSLRPWSQLTTGAPAALIRPPGSDTVADQLARLQGCERGTLATSTLHLFWDLFGILAGCRVAIYLDAGAYPIAWWGLSAPPGEECRCTAFRTRMS
jgi:8-amino-7-oxononanoate synthase